MSRLFSVIPAAGRSRRMGCAKLLLPYRETTVIGQVLDTLTVPEITATCVVTRVDDEPLRTEAARHGAWAVSPPVDPPDMRASVEFALRQIAERYHPADSDGWLLIPADHPLLSRTLLTELITVWQRDQPAILVPAHQGRRGHPTLFRWSTVAAVTNLPADRGLNALLERFSDQVCEWPCSQPDVTRDLDTPEDYERLTRGV